MKNENKDSVIVNVDVDLGRDVIILYAFESGRDIHERLLKLSAEQYIDLYYLMDKKVKDKTTPICYA